jgi:hypothetical protein
MGKRKHGTGSVPMTFSTRHYQRLRAMKVSGENVSAFIDSAIQHYDETFMPHPRGLDLWEVNEKIFRKNLSAVKRHVIDIAPTGYEDKAWRMQLRAWLALEIQGEVEEE